MSNADRIAKQHSASYLAVISMLFWGVAYVPSAWLVDDWPPLLSAAARVGVGGAILIVALLLLRLYLVFLIGILIYKFFATLFLP